MTKSAYPNSAYLQRLTLTSAYGMISDPRSVRYNKCGVILTELTPDTDHQSEFLDTRDTARSKHLMATVDAINRRMGCDTEFYANSGIKRDWAMAATMKSRHFTADGQQLLRIRLNNS